jgi:acyl-CoA thioester hydrolase
MSARFECEKDASLTVARIDSIINAYLIEHCCLRPPISPQIGLVVHSHCDFFGSVGFPSVVDLGLRVKNLGKSSVAYEVGVFERGQDDVRAVGGFTHVFVERDTNRPAATGMSTEIRSGLERVLSGSKSKL